MATKEPSSREIIRRGSLEDIEEFFHENRWSDGLPVIPPTPDRVDRFLEFTDRPEDEVIAVLPSEYREATVWNVAVNGVMAGCRPEYMPVLLTIVDIISEDRFRLEDAGSTPGWEPLVILSGPLVEELDFHYGSGAMRVGPRANTSVGRFLRLFMRNVGGFRPPPHGTDKATFGSTFNVAMAENEGATRELDWPTFREDLGFSADETVVTVQSVYSISPPIYTGGERAEDNVRTIVEAWGEGDCAYWSGVGWSFEILQPTIAMSPSIAQAIARDGWSKDDVREYIFENSWVEEGKMERLTWQVGLNEFRVETKIQEGVITDDHLRERNGQREVKVFPDPDDIHFVLAGDPGRNQLRGYLNNHEQGPRTSKVVDLPSDWSGLISE